MVFLLVLFPAIAAWIKVGAAPLASCALSLTPATIKIGETATLTATVTPINGTISNVTFISGATGVATVSPGSVGSSPYTTIATGISAGTSTITAKATMNNGVTTCADNTTLRVNSHAWWQVKDADVSTNGDLFSAVP